MFSGRWSVSASVRVSRYASSVDDVVEGVDERDRFWRSGQSQGHSEVIYLSVLVAAGRIVRIDAWAPKYDLEFCQVVSQEV